MYSYVITIMGCVENINCTKYIFITKHYNIIQDIYLDLGQILV